MLRGVPILLTISFLANSAWADSSQPVQPPPERKTASYRSGYQDGCSHATIGQPRNDTVYASDISYHDGWISGYNNCRSISPMQNMGRPAADVDNIF